MGSTKDKIERGYGRGYKRNGRIEEEGSGKRRTEKSKKQTGPHTNGL